MTNMNKKTNEMAGTVVREGYEASVCARALSRSGNNPQLKGIVHELMYCDKINAAPGNVVKGIHASLTKSPVAQMKDVIVQNPAGHIVQHAQLKDTISTAGVRKTVNQILDGHYNKTSIIGTEETAAKVNHMLASIGKKTQTVKSSGISSHTTSRIADKALGKMPTVSSLGTTLKSGGTAGMAFGAGLEAISSMYDVYKGDKNLGDAVADVTIAGIKGGVTGSISSAAGTMAAGMTGTALTAGTSTVIGSALASTAVGGVAVAAAPVVVGFAAACAVCNVISSFFDD